MTLTEVALALSTLYGNSQPDPDVVNAARKIIQDYADEHTRFVMELRSLRATAGPLEDYDGG